MITIGKYASNRDLENGNLKYMQNCMHDIMFIIVKKETNTTKSSWALTEPRKIVRNTDMTAMTDPASRLASARKINRPFTTSFLVIGKEQYIKSIEFFSAMANG
jgi:hypothetical protein